MISRYAICKEYQYSNQKEPLIPHDNPNVPWENVAADLFMWNNKSYLIVVDFYSRYFEVAVLNATTSADVIHHMKSFFSRHGIPKSILTDNGSQFTSYSLAQFCQVWKINHKTSSPLYPQSNGPCRKNWVDCKTVVNQSSENQSRPISKHFRVSQHPDWTAGSPSSIVDGKKTARTYTYD